MKKLQEDGLLVKDPEVVRMTKRGLFLGDSVAVSNLSWRIRWD